MPPINTHPQRETPLTTLETWTNNQPERTAHIIRHRLGNPRKLQTLTHIAGKFHISRQRASQLEHQARRNFQELILSQPNSSIAVTVRHVQDHIGAASPRPGAEKLIDDLELTDFTILMLNAAGPYKDDRSWLIRKDRFASDPTPAILARLPPSRLANAQETAAVYRQWGLHPHLTIPYISRLTPLRELEDGLLFLAHNLNLRIKQSLQLLGRPATPTEILDRIKEKRQLRTTLNRLSTDPAFVRTDKTHWALAEWRTSPYHSCSGKMKALLEKEGPMPLKELINRMTPYNLTPDTIRTNSRSPLFRTKNGVISISANGSNRAPKPLGSYPLPTGLFINGPRKVTKLVKITRNILRGTSIPIGRTANKVLQMPQGHAHIYLTESGHTLTLIHRQETFAGPIMHSMRQILHSLQAQESDLLAITLDAATLKANLEVTKPEDITPCWETLSKLTGLAKSGADPNPNEALATALMCSPEQVPETLRERNDLHVLAANPLQAIPQPVPTTVPDQSG